MTTSKLPIFEKTVDCSGDPYDLRPGVDAVIKEIRKARAEGKKILINVGELHDHPAHVLFNVALNKAIRREFPTDKAAVTFEAASNYIDIFAKRCLRLGYDFNQAALDAIKQKNPEIYEAFNNRARGTEKEYLSTVSRFVMWDIINRQELSPAYCVDIPLTENHLIDINHPRVTTLITHYPPTREELKEFNNDPSLWDKNALNPLSQYGMRLRNIFMLEEIRDKLKGHDIISGAFGLAHLGGANNVRKGYAYSGSLNGLALSILGDEVEVTNVFPITKDVSDAPQNYLSADAQQAMAGNTVFISGLSHDNYIREDELEPEAETVRMIFESSQLPINDIPHSWEQLEEQKK